MNVIISNLNSDKFVNLDIEVIKSITGEFTINDIVQSFSNFFFNRMFLDVTAIKDYDNVNNFKALSMQLDVSKIIFYLPNNEITNSEFYISRLISMGIYNFARSEDELKYLYDNPNSYRDVAHLQKIDDMADVSSAVESSDIIESNKSKTVVIGIKNITNHAGATSLVYMLKKQLVDNYNVVAIEINKRDFMFFGDKDMISCKNTEIQDVLSKNQNANVILIDLNDLEETVYETICSDVVYLMESSTLMINKLVMLEKEIFNNISNKNVVLNQSLLDDKDIKQLEFEANIKFFAVLPSLNDRMDNSNYLIPFLSKFGLYEKIN